MFKFKFIFLILSSLLGIGISCFGQELAKVSKPINDTNDIFSFYLKPNWQKSGQAVFDPTKDSITNIFFDVVLKEYIRFFYNKLDKRVEGIPKYTRQDMHGGEVISLRAFQGGIITMKNKKHLFLPMEEMICIFDGRIVTRQIDEFKGTSIFRSYAYHAMSLLVLDSLVFQSPYIGAFPINEGKYILMTEGEEYNHNFVGFDSRLKFITTFSPFNGGLFLDYDIESDRLNTTVAVSQGNSVKKITLNENLSILSIDSVLVKQSDTSKLTMPFGQLHYRSNTIIFFSVGQDANGQNIPMLSGYNKEGNLLWKENYVINGQSWEYADINKCWNFESKKLVALVYKYSTKRSFIGVLNDAERGFYPTLDIEMLYDLGINNQLRNHPTRMTYLNWIDSDRFIVGISEWLKNKSISDRYINTVFFIIDYKSKNIEILDFIKEPFNVLHVVTDSKSIKIVTNKFAYTYEKK